MKNSLFYYLFKRRFLLFFVVFCFQFARTQESPNVLWAKQFGVNLISLGVNGGIATDGEGNIYMSGEFWGAGNFGGQVLTASVNSDPFVVKTDSSGNVLWAMQFEGSEANKSTGITIDNLGNVYTTGIFSGVITFGSITLDAGDFVGIFVVKQDVSGNVLWATQFTETQSSSFLMPHSIITDTQGNIYVAGDFSSDGVAFGDIILASVGTTYDAFVVKQDPLGNVLWAKSFGGTGGVFFNSVISDNSDNIYLTGGFSQTVDFGDITLINSDEVSDIFLVKLNSIAEKVWVKQFETTTSDITDSMSYDLALDQAGNIYITGHFHGTMQVGAITLTTSDSQTTNSFIIKTDHLGEPLWAKQISSNDFASSQSIATDTLGNVYVTGNFAGMMDIDGITFSSLGSIADAFVLKMNYLGTVEWAGAFTSTAMEESNGTSIITDPNGDVLVFGHFRGMAIFGTTTLTSTTLSLRDLFLLKLSPDGLSIDKNQIGDWKIYPNPTNNLIMLDFPNNNTTDVSVEVFNILGHKVKIFENIGNTKTLDISELRTGIYLLKINHNGIIQTIKVEKL